MDFPVARTEAALKKISKPDHVRLMLNTEVNLGLQIAKLTTEVKDMLAHSKKLDADFAIVSNVNNNLVEIVVATKCQCWVNAQHLRRDMLEVVGVLTSVRDNFLERKVCDVFQEISVDICDRDIQACHCLKDKDEAIFKFTYTKDCL